MLNISLNLISKMFLKRFSFLFFCFWSVILIGQTNIKAMFYNTLNYNSDIESQNRTSYLKTILESIQPDLSMVCEMKNETASNYLFDNAILPYNLDFKKVPFKYSQSPSNNLLQMVYYNSKKIILESSSIIPTAIRDINHYTFKINIENTLRTKTFTPIIFLTTNITKTQLSIKIKPLKIKQLLIFNQLGQKVQELRTDNQSEINLDTSLLSKGIYYIKADFYKPQKIVKI